MLACGHAAQAAIEYYITALGTLGGDNSFALGINASGQVAGYSATTGSSQRAFLWTPTVPNGTTGTMLELDTGMFGGSVSGGYAINASGQVVGFASTTGDNGTRAFLWTPTSPNGTTGTTYDIGTLGGSYTSGHGVNASGQVVGESDTNGAVAGHAFLWTPTIPNGSTGTMQDLGTLGGTVSQAFGINDSGQMTGDAFLTGDVSEHPFLYNGTMYDLGTLGGSNGTGSAINAGGQVAGEAAVTGNGSAHAFLWTPTVSNGTTGTMQDLGTVGGAGSQAFGMNDHGTVVGQSQTAVINPASGLQEFTAFLWNSSSGMVDLNTLIDPLSGWDLQEGEGINNAGQIIGDGIFNGEDQAFLLTPVPEPSTCILAALAALGLFTARRQSEQLADHPDTNHLRKVGL
jgi:probable HAF family extracellular repeat protein